MDDINIHRITLYCVHDASENAMLAHITVSPVIMIIIKYALLFLLASVNANGCYFVIWGPFKLSIAEQWDSECMRVFVSHGFL